MSLENGTYQIKSILTGQPTIGRDYIENRSYGPKPIVVQKPDLEYGYASWQIERWDDNHKDGKCYLKIGGAATGLVDGDSSGRVFAIVRERFGGHSQEWILRTAAGTEEEGTAYNICSSEEGSNLVWTVVEVETAPDQSNAQIIALAEYEASDAKQIFTIIKENN